MKSKKIICCLLALCLYVLCSCGPDNVDYVNKVVGEYNVEITPSLSFRSAGQALPSSSFEVIETTCTITKDNEEGDVTIIIKGVNGVVNDIEMKAYCSGLGMNIEDSSYDGIMTNEVYGRMECDFKLDNPTTTISNTKIFNWESKVTGQSSINYTGLDMTCDVSGTISFNVTPK